MFDLVELIIQRHKNVTVPVLRTSQVLNRRTRVNGETVSAWQETFRWLG